jgi:hypothetical protein
LKFIQALGDVLIGKCFKATSLDFTEELIESFKATFARFKVTQGGLMSWCSRVVDVAVWRVRSLMSMLWLIVLIRTLRMAAIISTIWVDSIVVCGWT